MSEWSIRTLLNPVITRLLIYGVNPIDLEAVLAAVEASSHPNAHSLETAWLAGWEAKAAKYRGMAEEAAAKTNTATARNLYYFAAHCYYAAFLINLSSPGEKERIYRQYAGLYAQATALEANPVHYLEIPFKFGFLPGYLHLPSQAGQKPANCAVIFSGLGSCKEEMHTLARPLVERGIAVFVPDMPGNGMAVFEKGLVCRPDILQAAFQAIPANLAARPELTRHGFGAIGLCMGGGYAHHAASHFPDYRYCVALFPLFVGQVVPGSTPKWMKRGPWFERQTGISDGEEFTTAMQALETGQLEVPFLFIHGRHDNWMTLETASRLFEAARGPKEMLVIEDAAVYSGQHIVTHTMPVGEQLHWLRYRVADWVAAQEL